MNLLAVISPIIAALSVTISYFAYQSTKNRNGQNDTKEDVAERTTLIVGIENIKDGIKDIKIELREQRDEMKAMNERLVIVEQSNKSAHKRLDTIENRLLDVLDVKE